jgi:hypothetical protein
MMPSFGRDGDGNLQIHIPERDFGEFIQGLLSQPRSIRRVWLRIFDVDFMFARHLNELLKQRVQSQQVSNMVSFQSSIHFLDGRVLTLTSWEAFDAFNDNSDSSTTKLELIWSYLVKFPGKAIPEKQTIAVRITTGGNSESGRRKDMVARFAKLFIIDDDNSGIGVRIDYTELTWGIDILRHLEADISNKFISEYWCVKAIRTIISFVGLFLIPVLIAAPGAIYFLIQDAQRSSDKSIFMNNILKETDTQQSIILRLNYLINDHPSTPFEDARYWVYLGSFLLIVAAMALFALRKPRSYLAGR